MMATDTSEILRRVRKIEIKTKGLSKHIFSGEYHSAFKGRGMSFSEVRDYQYGDDVRNIDWNVTARTGSAHVKVYEEERELTVIFLVDMSGSSFFGTADRFKSEMIAEISAVLAFSAMNNNDKVGAILFTEEVEKYIPPKKGRKHILRIIRELIYFQPSKKGTNISAAIRYLNNVMKKRSIAFLASDFQHRGYEDAVRIAAKKHDLIALHVHDIREADLPNVGLIRGMDPETGAKLLLDTSSARVRLAYREKFDANIAHVRSTFQKVGLDVLSLRVDEDYVKALLKFFKRRIR